MPNLVTIRALNRAHCLRAYPTGSEALRFIRRLKLLLLLVFLPASVAAAEIGASHGPIKKQLDITFAPINEMSGLVKSRRFDDVYWTHNDSGDTARLFAVNGQGKVIFPRFLAGDYHAEVVEKGKQEWPGLRVLNASNIDWEDIAIDEDFIYIADLGNNGNARRDLGVYVLYEPTPFGVEQSRTLKYLPVRYPAQTNFPAEKWHYDSEAMFTFGGKLYFLSKNRKPGKIAEFEPGTTLFRLDTEKTNEANILKEVDQHDDIFIVTAAEVSPDGNHLAILCYTQIWVFDKPSRGDKWLSTDSKMVKTTLKFTGQAEAVTWMDNQTILIGNEGREWFTLNINDM